MTDDQRDELSRLRVKALNENSDGELVRELLAVAHLLNKQNRPEERDVIHRTIARIEGPETDGVLT